MKKIATLGLALALGMSLLAGCGSSAGRSAGSAAQSGGGAESSSAWPSTASVEIYVPFSAGGNSDLTARVFAEALSKQTGSNFVVVNQAEGGGAVCYSTVANAAADGSVIGWVTPSWFTSYFSGTHDLNPVEDFSTFAITTADTSQYLIVPKDSPFNTLDDLVNYCKENPGKLNLGMQLGSASHYYAESAAQNMGITWNYVEAGSDSDRVTAILGNIVEATTINSSTALDYVEAGEVKCLAALYAAKDAPGALAEVKSLGELGYTDITVQNCNFLFGPKMDEELAREINKVFTEAFMSEDVQQQLVDLNQTQTLCDSYDDAVTMLSDLYGSYHEVAESLNILAEGR